MTKKVTVQSLKPLRDHIVISALGREEVTAAGIVLPDTANKEKPQEGEVIAVGPGKMSEEGKVIPMHVKVGQKVLFSKYAPTEVEVEGEEYLILREDDVLAILE